MSGRRSKTITRLAFIASSAARTDRVKTLSASYTNDDGTRGIGEIHGYFSIFFFFYILFTNSCFARSANITYRDR